MRDSHAKPTDNPAEAAELERLRARVKELEDQLQSRPTPARASESGGGASGALKALAAGLGAMTALMVLPTYLTLRRWVRWWVQ
jgi:hypothetical protein